MRKLLLISILLSLIFANACINEIKDMKSTDAKYPVADKQPEKLEKHGDVRTDNYYWLNERENPEVIDYLNKENEYYQRGQFNDPAAFNYGSYGIRP